MARTQLVTLLTDFGTRDPYVAEMKGVILSLCPRAQLVDITHEVPAHNVMEAAFVWAQAAPFFPKGTVHIAVVDPGVGGERRILAARLNGQFFLAPDNGLLSFAAAAWPLEELVLVRDPALLPPPAAPATFHGRDVFAPLAGQILNGVELNRLGPQPQTYRLLDLPAPRIDDDGFTGQAVYIDRFGNLISNIPADMIGQRWPEMDRLHVTCDGKDVGDLQGTYSCVETGQPVAVINSMRLLEVAVNLGRACDFFQSQIGAEVRIVESK